MRYLTLHILLILLSTISPTSQSETHPQTAQGENPTPENNKSWRGKLADGTPLSQEQLTNRLSVHNAWYDTGAGRYFEDLGRTLGEEKAPESGIPERSAKLLASKWEVANGRLSLPKAWLRRAELPGAGLILSNLYNAKLGFSNLLEANLNFSYLHKTRFSNADLRGASLYAAHAPEAWFTNAKLQGASFGEADLRRAKFNGASLQKVEFMHADLRGASLQGANLQDADFFSANLADVIYEPEPDSAPKLAGLIRAKNLEKIRFEEAPYALMLLRKEFKTAGLLEQERQITYAIKRSKWRHARDRREIIDPLFNYIFFDLTVRYGMEPGRALKILGLLIILFFIPYIGAFSCPDPKRYYGVWRVWPEESIGPKTDPELISVDGWRVYGYALYFSLLSAFNIGWRELNVGNWIIRIQPRAYVMRATGTVRVIAGIQSLISVYLLAIWALTYFGRPFE